jgi:hypothetical protein
MKNLNQTGNWLLQSTFLAALAGSALLANSALATEKGAQYLTGQLIPGMSTETSSVKETSQTLATEKGGQYLMGQIHPGWTQTQKAKENLEPMATEKGAQYLMSQIHS